MRRADALARRQRAPSRLEKRRQFAPSSCKNVFVAARRSERDDERHAWNELGGGLDQRSSEPGQRCYGRL